MKIIPTTRLVPAALALGIATSLHAEPAEFEIDDSHFSIGFLVEHVGYAATLGQFLEAEGRFVYDESANKLHEGEVIVRADSVFTNHKKRDAHLRNDDFFDVDKYDTIRFKAIEWIPDDDNSGTLAGELTLLGESRPVELAVTLNKSAKYPFGHRKHTLGISARTTIQRSEWGMTYAVDNGLVGDAVNLILEFEAIRQ